MNPEELNAMRHSIDADVWLVLNNGGTLIQKHEKIKRMMLKYLREVVMCSEKTRLVCRG